MLDLASYHSYKNDFDTRLTEFCRTAHVNPRSNATISLTHALDARRSQTTAPVLEHLLEDQTFTDFLIVTLVDFSTAHQDHKPHLHSTPIATLVSSLYHLPPPLPFSHILSTYDRPRT